jgi:glycosyltransferase involved in cell wall biosynthesis
VILFAGKLVPAKQPMELLDAFLAEPRPDSALVFVGQGELRAALEARATKNPEATVRFLPFANQSQMPARYLLADLFVLPSRGHYETWGLAVNEAMLLGVPCLVSDRVGCQQDLVTEGETGWVFSVDASEGLRPALQRALAALRSDTPGLQARIAQRIAGYSYATAAQALQGVCNSLISVR